MTACLLTAGGATAQEAESPAEPPGDEGDQAGDRQPDYPIESLRLPLETSEWSGRLSAAAIDATVTARDQRAWAILWQMVGRPAPIPLPEGRMAIAVFGGADDGPPRRLEFSEVVAGETAMVIGYRSRLAPPPQEDQTTDTEASGTDDPDSPGDLSAPYVIRLLPTSRLPVYYVGTAEQRAEDPAQ